MSSSILRTLEKMPQTGAFPTDFWPKLPKVGKISGHLKLLWYTLVSDQFKCQQKPDLVKGVDKILKNSRIGVCRAAGIDRDRAESLASRCDQHREARASQSHGRKNLMPCADGRVDGCMTAAAVGSTAAMIEVRLSDGRVGKKGRHPRLRIVN
ncbi:hypothetical protein AXG93_523s1230 [Marchantia polymorpha subsp. ruderalis]|uniref:Uncharacterized protein n=1 Tax=Marchantia polymorpha subsp. ruderalis TaxID=1480154 RepID=A0A176VW31_MARPO|nr:hypothetical protein AXG93_523s1230 [Marchantia polymorpha subsp. ruderalis]